MMGQKMNFFLRGVSSSWVNMKDLTPKMAILARKELNYFRTLASVIGHFSMGGGGQSITVGTRSPSLLFPIQYSNKC